MKDLHTHALPGIDDGAQTIKDAISMLEDSFRQGVNLCALTPHCVIHNGSDISRFIAKRQECYEELNKHSAGRQIPKLVLGAEVYTDHDISRDEGIEKLCIGKSKIILLELPFMRKYGWFAECVHSLNLMGITVIVAHIDRYPEWENIISELRGLKVVYEISAARFLTFLERRAVKRIIRKNQRCIISSDMHNMKTRKCYMKVAFERARKMDEEFARGCLSAINADEFV